MKKNLPLATFVETGTFEGDTIELVMPYFETIHSIELSEEYYRKVVERFRASSKVHLHHGHSADVLRKMKSELAGTSILYWLDAHWCVADKTAGGASQCPLLEELDAIGDLNPQSLILIDDARLFLCPPPYPHEIDHWPRFQSVFQKLSSLSSEHEIVVANDLIIFFPARIRQVVESYTYEHSINWLTVLDKSRDYDILLKHLKEKEKELEASVEKERMIDSLHLVAKERVRALQEKEEEIRAIQRVATERVRALQEKEQMIEDLSSVVEQRLLEIHKSSVSLKEKEQMIINLKKIADEREHMLHELESLIKEKQKEIGKWTGLIHEMEQNLGYKLTMKLHKLINRK